MRKLMTIMIASLLSFGAVTAQIRLISGKVTDSKGVPVPAATVNLKGGAAVAADENGNFKINAKTGDVLTISSIDFGTTSVRVGTESTVSVSMLTTENKLSEVIVTAQGVRRRPKELGYSVARLNTEDIIAGRSPQLAQSLSGKVAGLAVFNVNNSVDPSFKINLRGYRSLTGSNDALIVVDGTPYPSPASQSPATFTGNSVAYANPLSLINPNDIESITVLKGGVAATIYGSDGVNGALVITTKKGTKGKPKVSYSHSSNFEEVSFLPEYQDKFGSGSHYAAGFGTANWKPNYLDRMKDNWKSYENQQYGDGYDGSMRPAGRTLQDGSVLMLPYSAISGERKRIWDKGFSTNNQVSVSSGGEQNTFYASLENNITQGIVPGDKSGRTGVRVAGSSEYSKFRIAYNAAYVQQNFNRSTFDFYNEAINQAAHIPLSTLRDWRNNKFASPDAYYNDYYTNPYFKLDNERTKYKDANLTGGLEMNYKITPWLTAYNRTGAINNTRIRKNTVGKYIYSPYAKSQAFVPAGFGSAAVDGLGITRTGTDIPGSVYDASGVENILSNEAQLQVNKDFGDFSVKGLVGFSLYDRKTKLVEISSTSIVVPGINNVSNRQGNLSGGEENTEYRKYGYYADVLGGWKDKIFLHTTIRYDATSKFYTPKRTSSQYSYLYYGVDAAAVITDLIPSFKGNVLSYAKLRAGINKNGNDNIALYGLDPNFTNASGFPYGNTVGVSVGDILPDSALRPEIVRSYEVGGEFQFLKGRISLDFSYYSQKSQDQVVTVKIPNSTGYNNFRVNIGLTKNWGYETDLRFQVIRSPKFEFDFNVRYSYNDNKVIELYPGVDEFSVAGFAYASAYIIKNQSFPVMKAISYVRDSATGRVIVNKANGYPLNTGPLKNFGRTTPKHMLGWSTRFSYGDFTLNANFEYRGGNVIYSDLGRQMTFTGSGKWTEDRTPHIFPNSAYNDGTGKIIPNTSINAAEGEYELWYTYYRVIAENFVVPGWFIKLRDINLSYNFPSSLMSKTKFISNASVSLFGRNLFTIVDKANQFTDPEYSFTTGNGQGVNTTAQTPPVRQYGINLNLTF
ncbi:MAG: SusC/RagA family TonB-linked outer membrane protein [Ferruginibacter sp.]|nr:SusC/RagA family TonB-linked outer membrane protein [Ferruginibacter sp.]